MVIALLNHTSFEKSSRTKAQLFITLQISRRANLKHQVAAIVFNEKALPYCRILFQQSISDVTPHKMTRGFMFQGGFILILKMDQNIAS